jgi:hypothetical protein
LQPTADLLYCPRLASFRSYANDCQFQSPLASQLPRFAHLVSPVHRQHDCFRTPINKLIPLCRPNLLVSSHFAYRPTVAVTTCVRPSTCLFSTALILLSPDFFSCLFALDLSILLSISLMPRTNSLLNSTYELSSHCSQ